MVLELSLTEFLWLFTHQRVLVEEFLEKGRGSFMVDGEEIDNFSEAYWLYERNLGESEEDCVVDVRNEEEFKEVLNKMYEFVECVRRDNPICEVLSYGSSIMQRKELDVPSFIKWYPGKHKLYTTIADLKALLRDEEGREMLESIVSSTVFSIRKFDPKRKRYVYEEKEYNNLEDLISDLGGWEKIKRGRKNPFIVVEVYRKVLANPFVPSSL